MAVFPSCASPLLGHWFYVLSCPVIIIIIIIIYVHLLFEKHAAKEK